MTTITNKNYYSACNDDGSISTSRYGANSDAQAVRIARSLLGGKIPAGVTLYRHEDAGGRINYLTVDQ